MSVLSTDANLRDSWWYFAGKMNGFGFRFVGCVCVCVCFCWHTFPMVHPKKNDCRSLVWSFLTNSTWNGSSKNFLERKHHDINYIPLWILSELKIVYIQLIHICVYVYKDVSTTYLHIYIYLSRLTWIRTLLVNVNINYYHIKLYKSIWAQIRVVDTSGQIVIFHQPRFPWNQWSHFPEAQVMWGRNNKTRCIVTFSYINGWIFCQTWSIYMNIYGCFRKWWYPQTPPQNDHF